MFLVVVYFACGTAEQAGSPCKLVDKVSKIKSFTALKYICFASLSIEAYVWSLNDNYGAQ